MKIIGKCFILGGETLQLNINGNVLMTIIRSLGLLKGTPNFMTYQENQVVKSK